MSPHSSSRWCSRRANLKSMSYLTLCETPRVPSSSTAAYPTSRFIHGDTSCWRQRFHVKPIHRIDILLFQSVSFPPQLKKILPIATRSDLIIALCWQAWLGSNSQPMGRPGKAKGLSWVYHAVPLPDQTAAAEFPFSLSRKRSNRCWHFVFALY